MPTLPSWLLRWYASSEPVAIFEGTEYHPERGVVLPSGMRTGMITGPVYRVEYSEAVPSWQAQTPPGTWLEVWLRAEIAGCWTQWYALGEWSTNAPHRHSVAGQDDVDAIVATDTLLLRKAAQALQWRVVLHGTEQQSPSVQAVAVAVGPVIARELSRTPLAVPPVPVPELSQMVYPNGGRVWCSPTALTMVLAYWYKQTGDPQLTRFIEQQAVPEYVAPAVYDSVYDGTGNWAFNTAYAATLGLEAYVVALQSLDDLAEWLQARVPLVASIRWQPGDLAGAPLGHSDGHLVVVVGIAPNGDVIVNDPAADPRLGTSVRRSYPRDQFWQTWQKSGRMVYLIYPRGWV